MMRCPFRRLITVGWHRCMFVSQFSGEHAYSFRGTNIKSGRWVGRSPERGNAMIYVAFGSILLLVCIVLWAVGETLIETHRFRQRTAHA